MLELKTAVKVMDAVNECMRSKLLTLEDACRMQPIIQSTQDVGYTILAMQRADMTILVWIQIKEGTGIIVRDVKIQTW